MTSVLSDRVLCFAGYRRRVCVRARVTDTWQAHRQSEKRAAESFGVLVGTTSVDRRELWIEAVTTPMALDRRSRFHFELRDPGHQRFVDQAFARSCGSQIYLGTWHTHPQPMPMPSPVDEDDWLQCLRRNRNRPLVFVVVGIEVVRVFVRWGNSFRSLEVEFDGVA